MNLSILRLALSNKFHDSPYYNNNCCQKYLNIYDCMFKNLFSSVTVGHYSRLFVYRTNFLELLSTAIRIDTGPYTNQIITKKFIPTQPYVFTYCVFSGISSSNDGGALYISTTNSIPSIYHCIFQSCSSSTTAGAFMLTSQCSKAIINYTCVSNCYAPTTNGFRILCGGLVSSLISIYKCSETQSGSYGSFWIENIFEKLSDLNSSYNCLVAHGAGIRIHNAPNCVIERSHIEACISMSILIIFYSRDFVLNNMNLVNNSESRDYIIHIDNEICIQRSYLFGNKGKYLSQNTLTFSECVFDIDRNNNWIYISSNLFNIESTLLLDLDVLNSIKCRELFDQIGIQTKIIKGSLRNVFAYFLMMNI